MARKTFDDDDGRVIADMSGIESQPMFLPRRPKKNRPEHPDNGEDVPDDSAYNYQPMDKADRRLFTFAALKATMLIALYFIVGLGLVVLAFVILAYLKH